MRNIQFWRLRHDNFQAIVAIAKQIVVAKEVPRAHRRSRCAKFGKDRLYRSAKRRAWQRFKINGKAAPSVPLPPFPNWITLHSHHTFGCRKWRRPDSGAIHLRWIHTTGPVG